MLKSLKEIDDQKNCVLVLAYLSESPNYSGESGEEWRLRVLRQAEALGIVTLNAEEEMRKVPGREAERLFLTPKDVIPKSAWGITLRREIVLAKSIYQRLLHVPALRKRLEAVSALKGGTN